MNRYSIWEGQKWINLLIRFYLGYVFIYACLHKIAHPSMFALDVATYDILPLSLVNISAIVLPWVELCAGTMILVGLKVRAAAWMISGMMVIFIIAVSVALAKGLDMSCGCFASQGAMEEDPISIFTVLRDTIWLGLALYVIIFDIRPIGIGQVIAARRNSHE